MDSTVPSYRRPSSLQSNQVSSSTQKQVTVPIMDVSPSLRLDDHFKADLFDFVSCGDYDLGASGLTSDWGNLDDIVGRTVNNNDVTVGDVMNSSWSYGSFQDPPTPAGNPLSVDIGHDKVKEPTTDKMWGGGGTEKIINGHSGEPIIIRFPTTDQPPNFSDTSHPPLNPSPPITDHSNQLDLFQSILNEKPYDVLASHNHRSPASDCVSYTSAGTSFSDSGISTSLDDNASPNEHPQENVDFDRLVDTVVDNFVYSPNGGQIIKTEVDTGSELNVPGFLCSTTVPNMPFMNPATQINDVSSILEGALRGTVRRTLGNAGLPFMGNIKTEPKTLTVMSNMTPLPPLASIFKADQLGALASSAQITSSAMFVNGYEYRPHQSEEYTHLDISFNKLSTTIHQKMDSTTGDFKNCKKRKYAKRPPVNDPNAKGRLLHFCHICQKGFKDKYSVNVHIRTHTGEKPFNCELCGKCFRQKAHLAKHVQIHNIPKPPGTKR